jgi:ATP/ADP translocase
MKQKLPHILNIKVSESGQVFDLLVVQFFIGLANALVNIVAFTLFIYNISIQFLPLAYMVIAGLLILLNIVYEKIEHRFSPLQLLKIVIAASAILLIPVWFGLTFGSRDDFIFILLVWSILIYMATGYAFWGLVSLLFNVRESKRVFSVAGAGDIPAKLIGYLLAPVLIHFLGLNNLIWFSVISLVTGYFLFTKMTRKKSWDKIRARSHVNKHKEAVKQQKRDLIGFFFKARLIFFISILSLLSYNVFNLVDYTFLSQVKLRYESLASLAAFIAIFFAMGRLIAIVLKLLFTSRVIERLGIVSCLFITPIFLCGACLIFFLFGFGPKTNYNVYIFGMMALLTEVLRLTIQEPVFFILFQPLKEHLRLKGHMISKGYMLPPSLLIVGLTLFLMNKAGVPITILLTIKILLLNLVVWGIIIFFIGKSYTKTIHNSIKKGIFHGGEGFKYDEDTISMLLAKVKEGRDLEVIYALNLLENANYPHYQRVLEEELGSGRKDIKKYALDRLEANGGVNPRLLHQLLQTEEDSALKEKMFALLCKHEPAFLEKVSGNMDNYEPGIRKIIVISLLNQTEFNYLHLAGNSIEAWLYSTHPADRLLAISIISEVKHVKFTHAIEGLIHDPDTAVKRYAITTACKLKIKRLLPVVIRLLHRPSDRYLVLKGLQQYGDNLFVDVQDLDRNLLNAHTDDLIKLAAKINGPHSTRFLLAVMKSSQGPIEKVLHALWLKGHEPAGSDEVQQLRLVLDNYLTNGSNKILDFYSLPDAGGDDLLQSAVRSEIKMDLINSLKTCSILFGKKEINRVLELLEMGHDEKLYNGMEMLDLVLPKKIASGINHLFDFVLDPSHTKKTVPRRELYVFFNKLFFADEGYYNPWTKAICVYCSWKNKESGLYARLRQIPDPTEHHIITETRDYVMNLVK